MVTPAAGRTPRTILLADDHNLIRAGLRSLLEAMPDLCVVGEAADGTEALRMAQDLQPSIALLDIAMPGMSGIEVLRELRRHSLPIRVILLSMYDNKEYVLEAVQSGADGYLIKDAAVNELALALAAVQRGDTYLSASVSRKLADAFAGRNEPQAGPSLTPRQLDVLRLLARGSSNKEIARELDLSVKTVETHRALLMERLGIRDLAGLVRYAIRNGLISDQD